jgi:hypothetical protein
MEPAEESEWLKNMRATKAKLEQMGEAEAVARAGRASHPSRVSWLVPLAKRVCVLSTEWRSYCDRK